MEKSRPGGIEEGGELEHTPSDDLSLNLSPDAVGLLENQPIAHMMDIDAGFREQWETYTTSEKDGFGSIELNDFLINETAERQDTVPPVYTVSKPFPTEVPSEDWTGLPPELVYHPPEPPSKAPRCPSTMSFEGDYGFYVNCASQNKVSKAASWTYDEKRLKLYVKYGVVCPIQVHTKVEPPQGTVLRAMPVYSQPEHARDVVFRCIVHKKPEAMDNQGPEPPEHLVRCESEDAVYHTDEGRQSVSILFNKPQAGMTYQVIHYRFMCLSSCVSGMNRRPIKLVFTLEHNDTILGRMAIDVKICTCPGRDLRNAQKALIKTTDVASIADISVDAIPPPKAPKREATSVLNVVYGGPTKTARMSNENGDEGHPYQLVCSTKQIYSQVKFFRDVLADYFSRNPPNGPTSSPQLQQNSSQGAGRMLVDRLLTAAESKSLPAARENGNVLPEAKPSTPAGDRLATAPVNVKLEPDISHKNIEDVPIERWLEELGMSPSCIAAFHERGYQNTSNLKRLSIEELKSLGLTCTDQWKVMNAAMRLHIGVPQPSDDGDQCLLQAASQGPSQTHSQLSNASSVGSNRSYRVTHIRIRSNIRDDIN